MEVQSFSFSSLEDVSALSLLQQQTNSLCRQPYKSGQGIFSLTAVTERFTADVSLVSGPSRVDVSVLQTTKISNAELPAVQGLPPDARALVWVVRHDALLAEIRTWLGCDFDVAPKHEESELDTEESSARFHWRYTGEQFTAQGYIALTINLIEQLEASAKAPVTLKSSSSIRCHVRGKTNPLALKTLSAMAKSDLLMVGRSYRYQPVTLTANNYSAFAVLDIETRTLHIKTYLKEQTMTTDVTIEKAKADASVTVQPEESNASFDQLHIQLALDFATFTADLKTIATMKPGDILKLDRLADDELVHLHSNNERVASGRLVRIGERLAVQLTDVV